jgi:hypothetical protein
MQVRNSIAVIKRLIRMATNQIQSPMPTDDSQTTEQIALPASVSTRREDVEIKQEKMARLLADANCEGAILLEPANFRWLTSGAAVRGVRRADECPAIFVNANQRWLLCSNLDTQRFFDEELDCLGFQVKEWPWHGNREQFLADLCFGRKVACDRPFKECKQVGPFLERERCILSRFEQECCRELGKHLAHAVEATARNILPGDTEEEVAGHLAHRLLKRGAEPVALQVCADDRAGLYRRPGFTGATANIRCLVQATACKFGLFATASRTVCFGPPNDRVKQEFDAANKTLACWHAAIRPEDQPSALFDVQQILLKNTPHEHEGRCSPPGWLTGRCAVERVFTPTAPERFATAQMVVWQARIGETAVCDTFFFEENGAIPVTAVEDWPVRHYVIHGVHYDRPDLLIRLPA